MQYFCLRQWSTAVQSVLCRLSRFTWTRLVLVGGQRGQTGISRLNEHLSPVFPSRLPQESAPSSPPQHAVTFIFIPSSSSQRGGLSMTTWSWCFTQHHCKVLERKYKEPEPFNNDQVTHHIDSATPELHVPGFITSSRFFFFCGVTDTQRRCSSSDS